MVVYISDVFLQQSAMANPASYYKIVSVVQFNQETKHSTKPKDNIIYIQKDLSIVLGFKC